MRDPQDELLPDMLVVIRPTPAHERKKNRSQSFKFRAAHDIQFSFTMGQCVVLQSPEQAPNNIQNTQPRCTLKIKRVGPHRKEAKRNVLHVTWPALKVDVTRLHCFDIAFPTTRKESPVRLPCARLLKHGTTHPLGLSTSTSPSTRVQLCL